MVAGMVFAPGRNVQHELDIDALGVDQSPAALRAQSGNFDIILDRFSRIYQLHPIPHAPCAVLYFVSMLIGCWLVLGIRCCDRFGAAGPSRYGSPELPSQTPSR